MPAFERLPGETDKAFQAAQIYFELGPDRSLEQTARTLSKTVQVIKVWSSRWNWVARAGAYDNHLANLTEGKREQAIGREADKWAKRQMEHRERAWRVSQALIEKAEKMLAFPLARQTTADGKTVVEPADWSLRDAARLLEAADKTARLAAELPTDIVEGMPTLLGIYEELRRAGKNPVEALDTFLGRLKAANDGR